METILEKLNGDNWSVLGEFETIQEIKDYLEVDWELDEEEIDKAIKDLNFKPGETLVKNILGDGEVELYDEALKCELEWIDEDNVVNIVENFNEVVEILKIKYNGLIEVKTYSTETEDMDIDTATLIEEIGEEFGEGLTTKYVTEELLQMNGAYCWTTTDFGFKFEVKYILINKNK